MNSFPTIYDFSTDSDNTVEYYYNVARDRFTNKYSWLNQLEQIDAIIIDADSFAQDIDTIFNTIYG
jgi:hypothetical protein